MNTCASLVLKPKLVSYAHFATLMLCVYKVSDVFYPKQYDIEKKTTVIFYTKQYDI